MAVFGILARAFFQGINKPIPALMLTLIRTIIISSPLAFILIKLLGFGFEGVWIAIIVGSLITGTLSIFFVENELVSQLSNKPLVDK
jgi:Na+-driven multidrug efflux pump